MPKILETDVLDATIETIKKIKSNRTSGGPNIFESDKIREIKLYAEDLTEIEIEMDSKLSGIANKKIKLGQDYLDKYLGVHGENPDHPQHNSTVESMAQHIYTIIPAQYRAD